MGIATDACTGFLSDPNINSVLSALISANPNCGISIDTDVEGLPHFYSSCVCSLIQPIVNSFGYTVTGYVFFQQAAPVFTADYPTSSPFVTSVGATQFLSVGGNIQEVACSILTGAIITTGGGFSSFQPMPSYQTSAVMQYLKNQASSLPPSFSYNPAMRAYPDISFNGHHYQIYYSNTSSDTCPCPGTQVDGTSCSSPALSGLFSLINDKLLDNNQSPLGFLNPLLYSMYNANPQTFNDITSGSNYCNRAYCCLYGYQAVAGYDVVSGLGSPSFSNMLSYILKAKEKKNR